MVPLRWTVNTVATVLRRRVLHGGDLLGAGLSVSLVFSIGVGSCLGGDFMCLSRLLAAPAWLVRPGLPSGVVLTAFSKRSGPLEVVSSSPHVDVPIQPGELSSCVSRIDVPIQPDESFFSIHFCFPDYCLPGP